MLTVSLGICKNLLIAYFAQFHSETFKVYTVTQEKTHPTVLFDLDS